MRKTFILAALLVLLFAAPVLFASWTEKIEVHVVDKMDRPISGATVTLLYQKSSFPVTSDESSLDGRIILKTNESGKLIIQFANMVTTPESEVRFYIIKANYSTLRQQSEKILCSSMGATCHDKLPYLKTFTFDAYRTNIVVQDQNGKPIEGAKVYSSGNEYTTGKDGKIWVTVPNGATYTIVIEYGGKKRTITGKINDADDFKTVVFNRYDLRFRVLNDKGEVVPADVLLDGKTVRTDELGYVKFTDILSDNIEVFVRYDKGFRTYNFALTGNLDSELIIDEGEPAVSISSKTADEKSNAIFISVVASDPNPKSSGLRAAEPVILKYNAGDGWKSITMYQTGKGTYQATIPLVYDKQILLEISAYDSQGNMRTITDSIKITKEDGSSSGNGGTQQPGTGEVKGGGLDMATLAAGIVVVLIVLIILYKKYTGEI
ncbi:MAG: hypothetical protein N3G76_00195 [Candidatus Micrarchaeota archaeon]|nr:hypothetical protein [Candidatus Micrarchaeota archaeon]